MEVLVILIFVIGLTVLSERLLFIYSDLAPKGLVFRLGSDNRESILRK